MATQLQPSSAERAPSTDTVVVSLTQLRVGASLRAPIYDDRGEKARLLLAAGSELTVGQLDAIGRHGVSQVRVRSDEVGRITNTAAGALSAPQRAALRRVAQSDAELSAARKPTATTWRCERDSYSRQLQKPGRSERDPQTAAQFERAYSEQVQTTTALFNEFVQSGRVNPHQVEDIAIEQLRELATDLDEFLARGLRPIESDYPSRHSLQTAMLATCVGTTMGLRKDDLIDLGFGCLLHDAGMLLVPRHLHQHGGALTTSERLELQKHPIYAADRLGHCNNVSHATKMVVYQMHERMNGSGYPRQRQGTQIHLFARVAAVADTYLALVSPRTFRPGLEPYQAVEKLLFATRKGLFDPSAVKALLHTISLFPIGSKVQLSDGRAGRVIRGNREHFAKPVVEIMDLSGLEPRVETIDLASTPDLTVVATADAPEA